ncbi:MAG: TlyA family RNA methyltransferase [Candidatus Limnocylindrales bacterium]
MSRVRLDRLLVERGFAETRSKAQALLMAGHVRVGAGDGGRTDRKPGELVAGDVAIHVIKPAPFVSRGGEKLVGALDAFGVDPRGRVCLDVGASTGGFTDALLQRGATRVYALDVGRGQLAESLRGDARVVSLERTHARRLDPADPAAIAIPDPVTLAVIDVSFISLTRVLAPVVAAVQPGAEIVALVKPQFEAGPKDVPKGVVRDAAVQVAAIARVRAYAEGLGLTVTGEIESPLVGPSGNHEWFLHLRVPA